MQEMTSMQQIEYMQREARKMGISWNEWRERFGHTLPKPKPTRYREIEYYDGIAAGRYKNRKEYALTCQMCGESFTAKRRDAQFCDKCKIKRARASVKACQEKKRREHPKQGFVYKNCTVCGDVFEARSRGKYCPRCARMMKKQKEKEWREAQKKGAQKNVK